MTEWLFIIMYIDMFYYLELSFQTGRHRHNVSCVILFGIFKGH